MKLIVTPDAGCPINTSLCSDSRLLTMRWSTSPFRLLSYTAVHPVYNHLDGLGWIAVAFTDDGQLHVFPFRGHGDTQLRRFAELCQANNVEELVQALPTILDLGDTPPELAYNIVFMQTSRLRLVNEPLWPEVPPDAYFNFEVAGVGDLILPFLGDDRDSQESETVCPSGIFVHAADSSTSD